MGSRRRLTGGFRVWLPDHRKHDGVQFRRYLRAGEEITGPVNGSALLRAELARYGVAGVAYERAAEAWATAIARRDSGRGRRPSERQVERAARRLGLANQTLKDATGRLEELAQKNRKPLSFAEALAARKAGGA